MLMIYSDFKLGKISVGRTKKGSSALADFLIKTKKLQQQMGRGENGLYRGEAERLFQSEEKSRAGSSLTESMNWCSNVSLKELDQALVGGMALFLCRGQCTS
jgi:hypothetical protein